MKSACQPLDAVMGLLALSKAQYEEYQMKVWITPFRACGVLPKQGLQKSIPQRPFHARHVKMSKYQNDAIVRICIVLDSSGHFKELGEVEDRAENSPVRIIRR